MGMEGSLGNFRAGEKGSSGEGVLCWIGYLFPAEQDNTPALWYINTTWLESTGLAGLSCKTWQPDQLKAPKTLRFLCLQKETHGRNSWICGSVLPWKMAEENDAKESWWYSNNRESLNSQRSDVTWIVNTFVSSCLFVYITWYPLILSFGIPWVYSL